MGKELSILAAWGRIDTSQTHTQELSVVLDVRKPKRKAGARGSQSLTVKKLRHTG
jgi:hypothetical protein